MAKLPTKEEAVERKDAYIDELMEMLAKLKGNALRNLCNYKEILRETNERAAKCTKELVDLLKDQLKALELLCPMTCRDYSYCRLCMGQAEQINGNDLVKHNGIILHKKDCLIKSTYEAITKAEGT